MLCKGQKSKTFLKASQDACILFHSFVLSVVECKNIVI